jgi:hypothetical protein
MGGSGRGSAPPFHPWPPDQSSEAAGRQPKNGPGSSYPPLSTFDLHCSACSCGQNNVVSVLMPIFTARQVCQHRATAPYQQNRRSWFRSDITEDGLGRQMHEWAGRLTHANPEGMM